MAKYAEGTSVSSLRTRQEIEQTLGRYGASQFLSGWREGGAVLAFVAGGRQIRFTLPLPPESDFATVQAGFSKRTRTNVQRKEAYEREVNRRWRALALIIKAKLEAVESGIVTFEDEFMPHTVLPSGQTASEWMQPQIAEAYRIGAMPANLPMLPAPRSAA